jgi:predicted ATP-grasp superfamily ATP-dependent carboligase
MHVLIAGISTRAAAESAARAGFQVTAIDAFGDLDQHPAVRSLSMPRDYGLKPTAAAVARAARAIECDAVAYLSPFENHPRALATLASGRTLLGNAPEVLRRVRDPVELARALQRRGFRVPRVRTNESHAPNGPNGPNDPNDPNDSNERWLLKPFASGGGHRIRHWRPTLQIPRRYYLQEFIEGTAGSVVFMSGAGQSVPLGITRQIIGDAAFGASGFRYCGSILASAASCRGRHRRIRSRRVERHRLRRARRRAVRDRGESPVVGLDGARRACCRRAAVRAACRRVPETRSAARVARMGEASPRRRAGQGHRVRSRPRGAWRHARLARRPHGSRRPSRR